MPIFLFPLWAWALCLLPAPNLAAPPSSLMKNSGKSAVERATIELAIVCDFEFGKIFNHDRQRILEYWTVFLADLRQRFKSLPSSRISIRVTSVTVISSIDEQPFIEKSRNWHDNTIDLLSVIPKFKEWASTKMEELPKFDIIMGVTAAPLSGDAVGIAYGSAACKVYHNFGSLVGRGFLLSVVMISDSGMWNVGVAAHELAHSLGADHDIGGCTETGFIMKDSLPFPPATQYFFSSCSDRAIADFLKSDQAACLKRRDHVPKDGENPELPVADVKLPSIMEQCQKLLKNVSATFNSEKSNCQQVECELCHVERSFWMFWKDPETICTETRSHNPVDGTICKIGSTDEIGNCFWGRCLPVGYLLVNKALGRCLGQENTFSMSDGPVLTRCPRRPTPLDQFFHYGGKDSNFLGTPALLRSSSGVEYALKCVRVDEAQNGHLAVALSFSRCSENIGSIFKWREVHDGYGHLILADGSSSSATSEYCIGYEPKTALIVGYMTCMADDPNMLWKRIEIRNRNEIRLDDVTVDYEEEDVWERTTTTEVPTTTKVTTTESTTSKGPTTETPTSKHPTTEDSTRDGPTTKSPDSSASVSSLSRGWLHHCLKYLLVLCALRV